MNPMSVASNSLSLSSPYNSLILKNREANPPTTYGDPTYPTITLVNGGGDDHINFVIAIGSPVGAFVGGGGTYSIPLITTYFLWKAYYVVYLIVTTASSTTMIIVRGSTPWLGGVYALLYKPIYISILL